MGFWHTGYREFHEETGLGKYRYTPRVYSCKHCRKFFDSSEDLRIHRVHDHPGKRPMLFVRGVEAGATPVNIRTTLNADDVQIANCKRAWINGIEIEVPDVGNKLSIVTDDTVRIKFDNEGFSAEFVFCFAIADKADLEMIDQIFRDMHRGKRLDRDDLEDFLHTVKECKFPIAADRYFDGIYEYLNGVLIKERRDSTLPYKKYREKWNQAANKLQGFDRPLARIIGALIAFHYNQFDECIALAGNSRVGAAAARYKRWLDSGNGATCGFAPCEYKLDMDEIFTDQESENVIEYCVSDQAALAQQLDAVEALVGDDIPKVDQSKLRVLLAEFHAHAKNKNEAKRHARELMHHRNPFRAWAKRIAL